MGEGTALLVPAPVLKVAPFPGDLCLLLPPGWPWMTLALPPGSCWLYAGLLLPSGWLLVKLGLSHVMLVFGNSWHLDANTWVKVVAPVIGKEDTVGTPSAGWSILL